MTDDTLKAATLWLLERALDTTPLGDDISRQSLPMPEDARRAGEAILVRARHETAYPENRR